MARQIEKFREEGVTELQARKRIWPNRFSG